MYECKKLNCGFVTTSIKLYVFHCNGVHNTGPKSLFECGTRKCNRTFSTYSAFSSHLNRDHHRISVLSTGPSNHRPKSIPSTSRPNKNPETFSCKICNVSKCLMIDLTSHMRSHFNDTSTPIPCPYANCLKTYTNVSSFGAHTSRKHGRRLPFQFHVAEDQLDITFNESCTNESLHPESVDTPSTKTPRSKPDEGSGGTSQLIRSMALFYLTLISKNHVPEATVQTIYEKYSALMTLTFQVIIEELKDRLNDLATDSVLKIIEEVFNEQMSIVHGMEGPLRSTFKRRKYFEENFRYVRPVGIRLGVNAENKECHMHYVPIAESLKTFLEDDTVFQQYSNNCVPKLSSNDTMTDFHDGSVFKNHPVLSEDNSAVQLIIYQDEFVVANPLGSSKKDLKMLAVYYTLGNLNRWNRSKVDPLQLILICKAKDVKYFSAKVVFSRLVNDLKQLETRGMEIRGKSVAVILAYLSGDNLGNHFIGGFLEGFNATYFCHYCLITKHDIEAGVLFGPLRTKESYDASCAILHEERMTNAGRRNVLQSHEGIKDDSVFNTLEHFHVVGNMPPCIGHDVFEGVAQYDIVLALRYFQTIGWLTIEHFNRRLSKFEYSPIESKNKPSPVSTDSDKLGGYAIQTWTLIRIIPLLAGPSILDTSDAVWRMLMLLCSIVASICSPSVTLELIATLDRNIAEYCELRSSLFPRVPLRPKHHFLRHYPSMMIRYGPLIRLWTMRFESKHKFFKDVIRSTRNTINVTKSLTIKHQYLQAAYSANGYFPGDRIMDNAGEYNAELVKDNINAAIQSTVCRPTEKMLIGKSCSFRGVKYTKENVVVMQSDLILNLLKITAVILNNEELYFVGTHAQGHLIEEMQVYKIEETNNVICSSIAALQDYQPYHIHFNLGYPCIVLKHLTC